MQLRYDLWLAGSGLRLYVGTFHKGRAVRPASSHATPLPGASIQIIAEESLIAPRIRTQMVALRIFAAIITVLQGDLATKLAVRCAACLNT